MAAAAAAAAGASITITVTDEGAGTSTTYTEPQEQYDKSKPSQSNNGGGGAGGGGGGGGRDRLAPGQMYVAKGVQSTKGVIISVREKHGSFRSAVPCMPFPMALICCIFNIFTPGLGTFLSAFTVFCCGFTETTPCRAFWWNLLAAFLQAITFIFIVGWIWSISWGMTFVTLAAEYRYEKLRKKQHYKPASPT